MTIKSRQEKSRKYRTAAIGALACVCCLTAALPVFAGEAETEEAVQEAAENTSAEASDLLLGSKESMVYMGTLDSTDTLTTWEVDGEEDVPYISLKEYMQLIYSDDYISDVSFSWDGNVLFMTHNEQDILVDLDAQTIKCSNWRNFVGPQAPGALPAGIVEGIEYISIRPSEVNESTQTEPEGYEISVADYGIRMIRHEDDVLMPFAAAQSVLGSTRQMGILAYNGESFFDIVSTVDYIYGNAGMKEAPNPYADMYYSGPFASRGELSEAYAKYNYGSMCMLLDLTYGHKEEKGITDFDSFFEENGLKDAFLTTDPKDDEESLNTMFTMIFDSGHDAEILSRSLLDQESIISKEALIHELLRLVGFENLSELSESVETLIDAITRIIAVFKEDTSSLADSMVEKMEEAFGPNVVKIIADSLHLKSLRPFFYEENSINIVGDTCVIYFEAFQEDLTRPESYYTKLPNRDDIEKSSFALFYNAFDEIKRNGNVKNVVVDLSYNGGGSAAALISLLGFLSEDGEVCITYQDVLNKNYCTEYYHIDTNLDGRFDDEDGYGGQYDFYILTTGYSYSCANAMPYFAQVNGLAKIIGTKPGGGDCVVGYYIDAYGRVGAMSGFLKLGTMDGDTFTSDETAVEVDIPFPEEEADEIYFHPEKIAEFISASAQGD